MYSRAEIQSTEKPKSQFSLQFLKLGTANIYCGGGPVHFKMCTGIPGPYLLDAASSQPSVTIKNASRHCHMFLGGGEEGTIIGWESVIQYTATSIKNKKILKYK